MIDGRVPPTLFGRDADLAWLRQRIEGPRASLVLGEAGIGKTSLVRAAAAGAGLQLREGGGLSTLSWKSYLPLERAAGVPLPLGDLAGVAHAVELATGDRVLLVDDLQWADPDTIRALPLLLGRVRLVLTVRTGSARAQFVLDSLTDVRVERRELRPLDRTSAARIVRGHAPQLSPERVDEVVVAADGNPFLLEELAATGRPSRAGAAALRARVRDVGDARVSMALLALLGRSATPEMMGADLEALVDAGFVVRQNGSIGLRHALLAEAAIDTLTADERVRLEGRLARSVDDPGEAARHHLAAGERDLAFARALEAAEHAPRAGDRARHLGLAAACATGDEANALRIEAARLLVHAGDHVSALAAVDGLVPSEPLSRALVHLHRGEALRHLGRAEDAQHEFAAGLAVAAGSGTETEVRLLAAAAITAAWSWERERARTLAFAAAELSDRLSVAATEAYCALTMVHSLASEEAAGLAAARRAIDAAGPDDLSAYEAVLATSGVLMNAGRAEAAADLVEGVAERARRAGLRTYELLAEAVLGMIDVFFRGAYAPGLARLEAIVDDPALPRLSRTQTVSTLVVGLIDTGRLAEARTWLGDELAADRGIDDRARLTYALSELELTVGRLDAAVRAANDLMAEVPKLPNAEWAAMAYVTGAWALVRGAAAALAPVPDAICFEPLWDEIAGLRDLLDGDLASAERRLRDAAQSWEPLEVRYRPRCLWGAGEAARRAGSLSRARDAWLEAEEMAARLGMVPLLAVIRTSLRSIGERRPPAPGHAVGAVTTRQREILELVGQGLTTAEIARRLGVANSTVERIVANAMRRLGARTRIEAAALIGARSIAQ